MLPSTKIISLFGNFCSYKQSCPAQLLTIILSTHISFSRSGSKKWVKVGVYLNFLGHISPCLLWIDVKSAPLSTVSKKYDIVFDAPFSEVGSGSSILINCLSILSTLVLKPSRVDQLGFSLLPLRILNRREGGGALCLTPERGLPHELSRRLFSGNMWCIRHSIAHTHTKKTQTKPNQQKPHFYMGRIERHIFSKNIKKVLSRLKPAKVSWLGNN